MTNSLAIFEGYKLGGTTMSRPKRGSQSVTNCNRLKKIMRVNNKG